jgi:hypothetical protein
MATASWGTHIVGVFPIPQCPCHIRGMGAVGSRLLSSPGSAIVPDVQTTC